MKPGFHQISNEEYHSGPGISKTGLMLMDRSPAHYQAREEYVETDAMILGAAYHTAALEPEKYAEQYLIMPEGLTRVKKKGKALVAEAEAAGKIVLSYKQGIDVLEMVEKLNAHPKAPSYLTGGKVELSGFWYDPVYPNILCKCRPDIYLDKLLIPVDLKSCIDARPSTFEKQSYNLGYYVQAAWILYGLTQITGVEHTVFVFVCQEKTPPFEIMIYRVPQWMIDEGMIFINRILALYAPCLENDIWPGYDATLTDLDFPGFAKRINNQPLT